MSKPHILAIDGNSIAHACHNGATLTCGTLQVQAIFGFLRTLRMLLEKMPGNVKPLVLWDGRAEFRYALWEHYKGNRKAMDAKQQAHKDAFRAQMPILETALRLLGVPQLRDPNLEADDLGGWLTTTLMPGRPITLVTGDKDWLQLVNEWVTWVDVINDRKVDQDNFFEFTGYQTVQGFVEGKALVGDNSDNVPGIDKLGDTTAQLLVAAHGSVENFLAKIDAGTLQPKARKSKTAATPHPEQALASEEGRALFRRNVALMDLRTGRAPTGLVTVQQAPNPQAFELLCQRLAFASIYRQMPHFLRPFGIRYTPAVPELATA